MTEHPQESLNLGVSERLRYVASVASAQIRNVQVRSV